jgi:hypothetical protein
MAQRMGLGLLLGCVLPVGFIIFVTGVAHISLAVLSGKGVLG